MTPKFIFIETYGCSANLNNSEIIKGLILQSGLELTSNPELADVLIINTCIVKEPTEKKIEARILELEKLNKPLIIAGCMPDVRKNELQKNNLYLLSNHQIKSIIKLIRKISENNYIENDFFINSKEIKLNLPKSNEVKKIGITQILEGCLGQCNFCITRFAKGKLFSYPQEDIIKNIQADLKNGCKEIWLTSQDNSAYGLDRGKNELIELLRKILAIDGKFRIRLGMMNPNHVLPILKDLVEIYKDEKIYKFLHIPLQSASNNILKSMNRFYKKQDFLDIIKKFRKQIPNITIATDIIVAYPGETQEDYQETLNLVKEIQPDVLNLAKYWSMKGTPAAELKQVPKKEAKRRVVELMCLFRKVLLEKNKLWINKPVSVLVYDKFNNNYLARSPEYKLVLFKSQKNLLGKIIKVKIIKTEQNHFIGELIN